MMPRIALAAAAVVVAFSSIPAGWVMHADRKNLCQFATPPDWKAAAITPSFVSSPDGKSDIVVSGAQGATLDDAKGVMEKQYPPEKVFEDTASRLWYEYTINGKKSWYAGVATKAAVCGAQMSFKDQAAADILKQVVNTLGAK